MATIDQTVLDNIRYQPIVLPQVLANRAVFVDPFVQLVQEKGIRKIIFFGSGTSYNVSHIAAYYFKHLVGMAAEAQYPTVFCNYEKPDWTDSIPCDQVLFVGISQSGTSVSTCTAMARGRELGCRTLAITGDLESEITRHVDVAVHLLVGEELTPPETKGYTVSVLSVYLWALGVARVRGAMDEDAHAAALAEAQGVVDSFQTVIDEGEAWYERNKSSLVQGDRIYVLGYGIDYGSMHEGMLKVGEMLRRPVIGYELEEYSHGPLMALRDDQSIVMIGSDEPEFSRMLTFRDTFKKYTPRVHVITCRDIEADARDAVFSIKASKWLAPLLYTVPFQFLAAKGAKDIFIDTNIDPTNEPLAHYAKAE